MIKTLNKVGNSYAMIIDKPILELLNIAPDTRLEIITDGDNILIRPADQIKRKKARKLVKQVEKNAVEVARRAPE